MQVRGGRPRIAASSCSVSKTPRRCPSARSVKSDTGSSGRPNVSQELQRIDERTERFGHDPVGEFVRGFFAFEPVEFTTQLDRFDSVFDFGQSIGGQQDGPAVEVQMSGGLLWGERDACQISGSRLCRK